MAFLASPRGVSWWLRLLCLLVITAHIYLRLDIASVGKHRGKLQLAAIATVAPSFELIETRGDLRGSLAKGIPDNLQQKGIILGTTVRFRDLGDLGETIRLAHGAQEFMSAGAITEAVEKHGDLVSDYVPELARTAQSFTAEDYRRGLALAGSGYSEENETTDHSENG